MKKAVIFILGILQATCTFANMNFIDINKISNDNKCTIAFNFIKDNQKYYDRWTNEWNYDKPKNELLTKLHDAYSLFFGIPTKNEESYLLLGDISNYLYNLDDSSYFQTAVNNYTAAIKLSPKDYRCYWFLGYHDALSNEPTSAIDNFLKAQELLPATQPSEFWNNYAWAMHVAQMPSHCFFAMDQVRKITGEAGSFETELGSTDYKRMVDVDKDSSYSKKEIWTASNGEKDLFTSRPLGIKLLVDTTWNLSIYDYSGRQSAFLFNPPALKSAKGKEIHYSIALIMKVANSEDKLDDYINSLIAKYPIKNKIAFSNKYDQILAYEIKDNTMYEDIGGGHLYMIGIERDAPKYPGLLLESPTSLQSGNPGQVTYYTGSSIKTRFKGKIFYAFLLDSCEDIHDQSLAIFKNFFKNQIVIE